ncbi:TolC family protein [Sphingopyxis sp.]|uniref:TolC family protein n=1 Tax=Sphingopyxis sp. TaxID=1908224 RepID=UPI003BA8E70B
MANILFPVRNVTCSGVNSPMSALHAPALPHDVEALVVGSRKRRGYRSSMTKWFRLSPPLLLLLPLGACAHFEPRPLAADPMSAPALQAPIADLLSRDAAHIDRPYLKPVALDLSAPLDPNGIAILAVISNPDLKAQRARAGVRDAQVFAAGLLPDPSFSFGVDHILSGSDPLDNIAGALGFSLNALRTQKVQRAQAVAEARQVRLDLAWAEWQTACNARLQAVRVLALEQALANAATSADASEALLGRYLKAAGRGDIAPDQVQSSRIAALDAQSNFRSAQTNLATARSELHRLLGLPPAYALRLAPAPLPALVPDADRLLTLALTGRDDLAALRAGYDAQEAAVRRAILDQFPTLDLTISGARDTGGNKLIGPSIGFTLPLWNRNRGGIAVAEATREALRQEYDARLFQTRADIAAAASGLAIARQQYALLRAGMPALATFALASRRAAQRGDLALATAEVAEQSLRDRQLLLLQSEQAIAEQTIALELLVGAPQEAWTL